MPNKRSFSKLTPQSHPKWTAEDVQKVVSDQFLAVALGMEPLIPADTMERVRQKFLTEKGWDLEWEATERARRIKAGEEPMPQIAGYR